MIFETKKKRNSVGFDNKMIFGIVVGELGIGSRGNEPCEANGNKKNNKKNAKCGREFHLFL